MRVLMLVQSAVAGDSRVLREASTLVEAGHTVHIVGRDVPEGFDVTREAGKDVTVESVSRSRGMRTAAAAAATTRPGPVARQVARIARWALLPEHRERTERSWRADARGLLAGERGYDVVHAHDYNTLELGAELARRWSVPLVYDSHELWFDRGLPGRPTPLARVLGRRRETRLAAGATAVLTVSEGIVDRLRARGLPDVRLVRNTFPLPDREPPSRPGQPIGLAYAGRVGPGRDLETVVGASPELAPLRTVVAGPADPSYRLDTSAVERRPAMSIDEVDQLYQELGIAVVTLTDSCDNHRLALPNKLFHAVRAGVPVVAADLPELHRVVSRHGIGRLYDPGRPGSLVEAVRAVATSYPDYADAVRRSRPELSWEQDARVLVGAYSALVTA